MILTEENIQFIDTYLENADVVFTDVRMEMVDHVASEIENRMKNGDDRLFYDVFKSYMIEEKSNLLKSHKKHIKTIDKALGILLLKQLYSIKSLLIFMILFCGFKLTFKLFDVTLNIYTAKEIGFIQLLLMATLYFVFLYRKSGRFSGVERLGFYFGIIIYLFNTLFDIVNSLTNLVSSNTTSFMLSFFLTLSILWFLEALKQKNAYQKKFKTL
ncbi:hypothetical protein [Lacinutrix undariae]